VDLGPSPALQVSANTTCVGGLTVRPKSPRIDTCWGGEWMVRRSGKWSKLSKLLKLTGTVVQTDAIDLRALTLYSALICTHCHQLVAIPACTEEGCDQCDSAE